MSENRWVGSLFGLVLRTVTLAAFALSLTATHAQGSFEYRKSILIRHTQVSGSSDLIDFPLLVHIVHDDLKSLHPLGYDIVFRDADGLTPLDHEIEKYEPSTGEVVAWVRIPVLDHDDDTLIYMYYKDTNITTPTANAPGVWGPSYRGVWHLKEDPAAPAPQMQDSTSLDNDGISNGAMTPTDQVPGQIDGSLDFDGADDVIDTGDRPEFELPIYSWSMWLKGNNAPIAGVANEQPIWNAGVQFQFNWGQFVAAYTQTAGHRDGSGWQFARIATVLTGGTWYYIAGTYDGANIKVYLNGALEDTQAAGPPIVQAGVLAIGSSFVGGDPFPGQLDEVRISNGVISEDWLTTEFNNQDDPMAFYAVANQESVGDCCPLTTNEGGGTITLTAPDSFELRFNAATGGAIDQWFELNRDPGRSTNLLNATGADYTHALIDFTLDNSGDLRKISAEPNATLNLLEVTSVRTLVRTQGHLDGDVAWPYQQETAVYGTGRLYNWIRFSNQSGNNLDRRLHWYNATGHSVYWQGMAEGGALPRPYTDDWALRYADDLAPSDDHYGNVLFIPSQDYGLFSPGDDWKWKNDLADDDGFVKLDTEGDVNLVDGGSWTFINNTVLKPDTIESAAAAQPFSDDYRMPDDLGSPVPVGPGSGWFDTAENTVVPIDFFNEAEGTYNLSFEPAVGLTFDIDGATFNRFHPVFKIRRWRSFHDPSSVLLEGVPLTNETDYRADVKPISRAHFADDILYHTTLEDWGSVTNPDIGDGSVVSSNGVDWVPGVFGGGAELRQNGDHITLPLIANGRQNIELDRGRIEFWYRPDYNHDNGNEHYIFDIDADGAVGGSRIRIIHVSGSNTLDVEVFDSSGIPHGISISETNYKWLQGEWVHLAMEWDSGAAVDNVDVYLNGKELIPSALSNGAFTMEAESTSGRIRLCNRATSTVNDCLGILDEFTIYSSPSTPKPLAHGGLKSHPDEFLAHESQNFALALQGVDPERRGEYLYLGSDSKFGGINIAPVTMGVGVGAADLEWEYWNGTSWASLSVTDDTNGMTQAGAVHWASAPAGWSEYSVNGGSDLYTIRAHLIQGAAYTTYPVEGFIKTDILLFQYCGDIIDDAQTFEFGPVVPTAVELRVFEATGLDGEVLLEWETSSEIDNLGFYLYRSESVEGPYERVNSVAVPGLGSSPVGAKYSFRDQGVVNGTTYYYELEDFEASGQRERHGPVSARPEAGLTPEVPVEGGGASNEGSARIEYGETGWTLRELSRGRGYVELELVTRGFSAVPLLDGSMELSVEGFAEDFETGSPAVPVKRVWIEALAGKEVRIGSVRASDVTRFSLLPASADAPAVVVESGGTVRAGRKPRQSRRNRFARAEADSSIYPADAARVVSVGFEGDDKKALLELAPLRWEPSTGQLELAQRLVVRVEFAGDVAGERSLGGTRGRRYRGSPPPEPAGSKVLARLSTSEKGLYGVSYASIYGSRGQGLTTNELRLSHQGESVAYHVEPSSSVFGPGSVLYFVSEGAELNPYGVEAVYELEVGRSGELMSETVAPPSGLGMSYYFHREEDEENHFYATSFETPLWLWETLLSGMDGSYGFEVSELSLTTASGEVEVWLKGVSRVEAFFPPRVRLSVNGVVLTEEEWESEALHRMRAEVPPGVLVDGPNTLLLENVSTSDYTAVMLDRFTVSYPRRVIAESGVLRGKWSESGRAEVSGIDGGGFVLDVTESTPLWVTETSPVAGGLAFHATSDRSYLVVSPEAVLRPEVRRATSSRLEHTNQQADYLVLGPKAFLGASIPLLRLRRSQGLRSRAVSLEEVYAEFGHGESRPEAIREFLSYAYHEWQRPSVRYVVLLGDGTYDFKDYLGTGVANHVPPRLEKTSFLWTASDAWYARVNGDDVLADLSIGRLPASTVEEARVMVEKIVAYETTGQNLSGSVVLVTDDPDQGGDFEAGAEELAGSVLVSRAPQKIYLGELGVEATKSAIGQAFDEGASLLSYIGHGSITFWAQENVFDGESVSELRPQSTQPLVLTMNCLNGFFHYPYLDALAEELVKAEDKAAIAVVSPSGLSLNDPAHRFHQALLEELTSGENATLGQAMLAAQSRYADKGEFLELLTIFHLFGDPALKLQ